MEAMGLVHSRIRRVLFLRASQQGALGSVYCLHRLASLNHRFRVFQGVEEEEEGGGEGEGEGGTHQEGAGPLAS